MASIYKKMNDEPFEQTNLPLKMKQLLKQSLSVDLPMARLEKISNYDLSVKFLLELKDGSKVETVLMPEKNRITICISSQVGCAQGCIFCYTGKMGLIRNLTSEEIVSQVVYANKWISKNPQWLASLNLGNNQRITNVVFMGMGEPCDNVDNVLSAIEILTDPWGLELAPRKVTVSTAGHLDGLKGMYAKNSKICYAFSMHSTKQSERSKLMPINRKYPLEEVLSYLANVSQNDGKSFLIQYTVINKINDSLEDAKFLADLLEGVNCKVNLIPLNPIDPTRLSSPVPERLLAFRDSIHNRGIRVMIRYSKGQDIDAACGQLVSQN